MEKIALLEHAIKRFTTIGSKKFTLDELASELQVSKKTIYKYFLNKEDLVAESVTHMLEDVRTKLNEKIDDDNLDSLQKVIWIYKICFEYLKNFKPTFIVGLKKHYQKADTVFESFRFNFVRQFVYYLLIDAQKKDIIRDDVNIDLVSRLFFHNVDNITFQSENLFNTYSTNILLDHLIINSLRGIVVNDYSIEY